MGFKCIDVRHDGPVEHLVLNRPEVRNAFDDEMIREITESLPTPDESGGNQSKVPANGEATGAGNSGSGAG